MCLVRLRSCKGSWPAILSIVALLLLSWPPVDWLVSLPLEGRYPVRSFPAGAADAIVVLSSAVNPPLGQRPYSLPDKQTYQRCEFASWLHRYWRAVPVLACGGPGKKTQKPFAVTMRELLERSGVPEPMIWTEERSLSTHENAQFGAEILRKHGIARIALVVEAQSMLRAEMSFRKEGITVIPAPCEFREFDPGLDEFMPSWRAISRNETALHEALGLAWYRLRGWA